MTFWKKWFDKKEEQPFDPFTDLVLEKMQPGYLVDFDGKTWEVIGRHFHDLGDGYRVEEWELHADNQEYYLTRGEDEGGYWTWTRRVPIGSIDGRIRGHIRQNGDPPDYIDYDGTRFLLDSYGGAKYHRDCKDISQPYLYWDYKGEDGIRLLSIQQWGDIDFEAFVGHYAEEYQFTNILPRKRS